MGGLCSKSERPPRPDTPPSGSGSSSAAAAAAGGRRGAALTTVNTNYVPMTLSAVASLWPQWLAALKHLELKREQMSLLRDCGDGRFGSLLEGEVARGSVRMGEPVYVAMAREDLPAKDMERFVKDAVALKDCNHVSVLAMAGVCFTSNPMFVALQFCQRGTLHHFLRVSRGRPGGKTGIDVASQVTMCQQVADAVKYLHSQDIVHGDLGTRSCFMDQADRVKVGLFGIGAALCPQDYVNHHLMGRTALRWLAPETLASATCDQQSDIWMLGVLFWEIFSFAKQPWEGLSDEVVTNNIKKAVLLDKPPECPSQIYQIMEGCWESTPDERPVALALASLLASFDVEPYRGKYAVNGTRATDSPSGAADHSDDEATEEAGANQQAETTPAPAATEQHETSVFATKTVSAEDTTVGVDELEPNPGYIRSDVLRDNVAKALAEASAVPAQTPAPPLPAGSEPAVAPAAAAAVENGGIIPEDDGYVNDAVAAQAAKGIFPQDPDDTSYVNDRIVQEQQERAAAAAAAVVAEAASSVGVHPTNNMVSSPQASRREPLLQADDNDDANNLNNRNFNHSAPQNTNVSRQAEGRSGSPAGMAGDGGLEYVNDSVAQQAALGYIPEDGSEQQYVNDRVVSEQQGSSFAPPRPPSLQQTNKNLVVAVTTATAAAAEADEDGLTSAYIGEDEATSQGVAPEDPSLEPGDLTSGYVDDAAAVPPATSAATVNQGLAAPAAQSTRVDSRPPPVPSAEDERPGDYINDQAVAEQLRILEEKRRLAPALPPRADKQSTTPASAATPASPARPAQQNQRPANSQGVISFQNAAATEEESSTDPEQAVPISVAGPAHPGVPVGLPPGVAMRPPMPPGVRFVPPPGMMPAAGMVPPGFPMRPGMPMDPYMAAYYGGAAGPAAMGYWADPQYAAYYGGMPGMTAAGAMPPGWDMYSYYASMGYAMPPGYGMATTAAGPYAMGMNPRMYAPPNPNNARPAQQARRLPQTAVVGGNPAAAQPAVRSGQTGTLRPGAGGATAPAGASTPQTTAAPTSRGVTKPNPYVDDKTVSQAAQQASALPDAMLRKRSVWQDDDDSNNDSTKDGNANNDLQKAPSVHAQAQKAAAAAANVSGTASRVGSTKATASSAAPPAGQAKAPTTVGVPLAGRPLPKSNTPAAQPAAATPAGAKNNGSALHKTNSTVSRVSNASAGANTAGPKAAAEADSSTGTALPVSPEGLDLLGSLKPAELIKGDKGFGFVIKGSSPVSITQIDEGGAAQQAGLTLGDAIVRFNGADVYFLTQKELVQMFLNEGARPIKLEVKNFSAEDVHRVRQLIKAGYDFTKQSS